MEEARGAILSADSRFWELPGQGDPLLDQTRRIVQAGEFTYRFVWELTYRNGTVRRQYERRGSTLFQTLFAKLDPKGIKTITVYDAACPWMREPVTILGLPEGAEADILCNVGFDLTFFVLQRIYTFGWKTEDGKTVYFHIDSAKEPPKSWLDSRRLL